jgi:hypothetical protein
MSYFKNTNPEALAAWDAQEQAKIKLHKESDEFAEKFDGEKLISSSTDCHCFYGIRLNNWDVRSDRILWTYPERRTGVSVPRSALKKQPEWTKEQFIEFRRQLKELKKRYNTASYPSLVALEPFWQAIGTTGNALLFFGIHVFKYDGAIYIKTDLKLERGAEILGSEYDAAYAAMKSAEEPA